MAKFLQYRDGGKTDEKGISTHLYGLFQGQVTNGLAVTQNSPLGMSVLVSKGRCMIDSADDYPYLGFTDANEVVTITAADGSNPRIDAIVAYVDLSVVDSTSANNPGAFEIVAVAGTPAGSPNPPNDGAISTAIGLGNPFIRLAHVTVGTGVTTITTGNVSDQRVFVGLPDGFIRSSDTLGQSVVLPENRAGGFYIGIIPGSTFETTGNKTITGVGFKPKLVRFTAIPTSSITTVNFGTGAMSEDGTQYVTSITSQHSTSNSHRASSTASALGWLGATGLWSLLASYVSMNDDGFTISVSTANSAFDIAYEAYA